MSAIFGITVEVKRQSKVKGKKIDFEFKENGLLWFKQGIWLWFANKHCHGWFILGCWTLAIPSK